MAHGAPLLTKEVFLESLACARRGWLLHHPADERREPPTLGERFRLTQGNAVGDLARQLLGPGHDLRGPATAAWIVAGHVALADQRIRTLFEAPVVAGRAMARPDVLQRFDGGWRLIEVKSAKSVKPEYLDDLGYTLAIVLGAGLAVNRAELALVNPDWRSDNHEPPVVLHDVTNAALVRAAELAPLIEPAERMLAAGRAPDAVLTSACRKCRFRGVQCFTDGPEHPVFELPSIRSKRVDEWIAAGITRIDQVGAGEKLTAVQQLHRRAVVAGDLVTVSGELAKLAQVREPAVYLDFETVALALPPFAGIAPYDAIPIQYSLHRRAAAGGFEHRELLVDPAAPDLEYFARHLLDALEGAASIVVYSAFERQRLQWLAGRVPTLAPELDEAVERLVDLLPIVQASVAHPAFHGSLSIKKVLPVLVPPNLLTYDGLQIANGDDATGAAGLRAMGHIDDAAWEGYRAELLRYCAVDTMAMVRLHEALLALG